MDFALARHNMVESQVRTNRVTDPLVIAALSEVPREEFVPKKYRGVAYMDDSVSLGGGRWLMEPMAVARLLQAAAVQPDDVVLDVGAGTGYAAAVLARLASVVVALEGDSELVAKATKRLGELGIDNVSVVQGDLAPGYAKQAPYDVIFIEGAVGAVPEALVGQLAEGGRMVSVIAGPAGIGRAMLTVRSEGRLATRDLFDVGVPSLPGLVPAPKFRF